MARTVKELGLQPVIVYTEPDALSLHVTEAKEKVLLSLTLSVSNHVSIASGTYSETLLIISCLRVTQPSATVIQSSWSTPYK